MAQRLSFSLTDEDLEKGSDKPFTPLGAGWYDVEITEVEEKESKSAKNNGKPMYNFKFKLLDGQEDHKTGNSVDGRFLFANACLWKEAIFTYRDIAKAVGFIEEDQKDFDVNDTDDFVGRELSVRVKVKDKYFKNEEDALDTEGNAFTGAPGQEKAKDNETNGYRSLNASSTAKAGKAKGGKKGKSGGFAL